MVCVCVCVCVCVDFVSDRFDLRGGVPWVTYVVDCFCDPCLVWLLQPNCCYYQTCASLITDDGALCTQERRTWGAFVRV